MTDPIKPALSPEEWALRHHFIQCFDSWDEETVGVGEVSAGPDYLHLTSHQHPIIAVFDAQSDRHALAALALHGQPFGFGPKPARKYPGKSTRTAPGQCPVKHG